MGKIIGIVSGKGGVGKTTLTINLGSVLAQQFKKNVTVIDCNVTTSHLGLYLGMYYSPVTLNKVLRGESKIEDAIYEHFSGMKVIPASLSLSELEGIDVTQIRSSIENIVENNDIILLDSAPGLGREGLATFKAADEVIFVTTPYVPSVMDIVRCQEIVNELGIKPIGIVLNMVHKEKHEMSAAEIEQLTKLPVIASIPFDKNVNRSLAAKIPIVMNIQNSSASKEMFRLGATLIGENYKRKGVGHRILQALRLRPRRNEPV